MRWVNIGEATLVATLVLGLGSTGCTAAVLQGAAGSGQPTMLAALPFALIGDAVMYGLKGQTRGGVTVKPQSRPSLVSWRDPDDWVGECDGPTLCADYQHFECRGVPGDCSCDCVVTRPETSVARAELGTSAHSARLSPAK